MSIEKYGHKINTDKESPGSVWSPEGKERVFESHTCMIGDLISDAHYDVFVKYGYANSLINGKDEEYLFWSKLYDKMQTLRTGNSRREQFDLIIRVFQRNGFDEKFPIPVNEHYDILDGSHRLACAALLEKNPKVEIYKYPSHSYSMDWFKEVGFVEEELSAVNEIKEKLYSKYRQSESGYYVGIIWGIALNHWEEILHLLKNVNLKRAFIKDFGNNMEGFIHQGYLDDGMSSENIVKKAQRLSKFSTKAGLIAIDSGHESIISVKKNIRKEISKIMDDYFYDCIIHIIDDKDDSKKILSQYDVKNN